jgi:hypothetical protein
VTPPPPFYLTEWDEDQLALSNDANISVPDAAPYLRQGTTVQFCPLSDAEQRFKVLW